MGRAGGKSEWWPGPEGETRKIPCLEGSALCAPKGLPPTPPALPTPCLRRCAFWQARNDREHAGCVQRARNPADWERSNRAASLASLADSQRCSPAPRKAVRGELTVDQAAPAGGELSANSCAE